ncbi:MAG TPA: hypothetical protein VFZ09_33150 [Archangium sp.]|uniref:hypothetical protein n=1 Tax=Archangium sp. TaxID=1872627 RepID=UPI002E33BE3D|nr:hypothetical protein [Archangium sp.]HEX5751120.1 hypothetical protein [Archangium sp.]
MERKWWRAGIALLAVVGLVHCGVVPPEGEQEDGLPQEEHAASEEPLSASWRSGSSQGATRWFRHPRTPFDAESLAIVQDADRNVIVSVSVGGTIEFEPGHPLGRGIPEERLIAVAKYAPDGRLLWARTFEVTPGSSPDFLHAFATALAVDREGHIVLAGSQTGTIDFGGGLLPSGAFLVKLDREGGHVWSRHFPSDVARPTFRAEKLLTDREGNIGLAATVVATMDFGGGPLTLRGQPVFVRFSPEGGFLWAFVDDRTGFPRDAAVDSEGRFILAGGREDGPFVYKLDRDGTRLWERRPVGANASLAGVAAWGNRIVLTGVFAGCVRFDGRRLCTPSRNDPNESDGLLLAYTADGEERWARHFGRASGAIAVDPRGSVVVTGVYEDGDRIGSRRLRGEPGANNVFVARFDKGDGDLRWIRTFPGPSEQFAPDDISVDSRGESALLATFSAPVTLEGTTLVPEGGRDFFILKLAP